MIISKIKLRNQVLNYLIFQKIKKNRQKNLLDLKLNRIFIKIIGKCQFKKKVKIKKNKKMIILKYNNF